ncbi:hypothetical protein GCM10009609_17030 [Pseudonocardia aurantiaca]|uniref:Uncharacterized protein n=1 Tax=Pseudonocardia aurantiaca TaxID=75290 RepID=A0ABW4FKP7_9PSEU
MIRRIRAFLDFWYDFVVGDDWRVATGVVVALVLTFVVTRSGAPGWWVLPVAVVILLPLSLWRVAHRPPPTDS